MNNEYNVFNCKNIYEKEYFADNHSETWILEPNSTDENTRNLIKQYERTNKKGIFLYGYSYLNTSLLSAYKFGDGTT